MKKNLLRWGMVCLTLLTALTVKAQGGSTPALQEKLIYSTDFSDWDNFSASTTERTVSKSTKYSHETLNFAVYNTALMSVTDTKFQNYTELPHNALQAAKAADPYVKTSTLASVSKVRFVHAATGNSRGWKLEAKGDGDADWVVIASDFANPAGWCPVTANVNRTNVQLRWTNLNASQNAYMFELDMYGMVDMSAMPALGKFTVNGTTYEAADIFSEDANGNMTGSVEISKTEPMISASNPITDVTADNGEIGTISYNGTATQCVVTIPVTANGTTMNYLLTVVQKPDFTLTYYGADGTTVLGTQQVEKDAKIGSFNVNYTEAIPTNMQFRGWHIATSGLKNRKYTVDDIITANINLFALVTPKETASASARYDYILNDRYFYADDHEAFNPQGGAFHDLTHGWEFYATDKIELLMGEKGYVKLGLCAQSATGTITLTDPAGNVVGTVNAKATTDGKASIINFTGTEGIYTLTFTAKTYMHDLAIVNMAEPTYTECGAWRIAKVTDNPEVNGSTFLTLLELTNATEGTSRTYIYLPNGDYNLGERALTAVTRHNVSIVGQDMYGTVIRNHPTAEGIGITATILNQSSNLFMQNLTLKNELDYFNSSEAGRAVCLQDKGNHTICKRVRMLSYQDTYYSNTNGTLYWEKSEIHGVVDYMCGGGDVYYNECMLVNESRAKTPKNGDVTMTAPYPSDLEKFGYVFNNCTVENRAKSFNFGRSWGGNSKLYFINTTLNQPNEIVSTRFTTGGMNTLAYEFKEYHSMDKNGNVVSPAINVLTFTKDSNKKTYETIMTDDEAAAKSYENLFTGTWNPKALCADLPAVATQTSGNNLTWTAVEGAEAYSVYAGGQFLGLTTDPAFTLPATASGTVTVMAHNALGAYGTDTQIPTAIKSVAANESAKVLATNYYTLQGVRVNPDFKGIAIRVDILDNGQQHTRKVIMQ